MKPQIIRHGEVILKPVKQIPAGAILKKKTKKEIIAHSETGHHHILETKERAGNSFSIFTINGETYLELEDTAKLWHKKTGDSVHKTHDVIPSVYKIIIKREFDYFEGAIRNVKD